MTILIAALLVLVAVGLSLGINYLVARVTQPGLEHPGTGELLGALFSVYGILLSLVLVSVWDDYQRARQITTAEVSYAVDAARAVATLPPPLGEETVQDIVKYYDLVLDSEFPAMQRGEADEEVTVLLTQLWNRVATFSPSDQREAILQEIALKRLADVGDQRRMRLLANERRLPALLWSLILAGALLVLSFSALLGARERRALALRMGIAALLGLTLFCIYALERPFASPTRIDASDIKRVRELLLDEPRGPTR